MRLDAKRLDCYNHASHSHPRTCQNKTRFFFIDLLLKKIMRVIIFKMKKIKRKRQNQKLQTNKGKTKVLYSEQKMKIENNWKKMKG